MIRGTLYRSKPVVKEAMCFDGTMESALLIINWAAQYEEEISHTLDNNQLIIVTIDGTMTADEGDFIIKGVRNEFYPCKPDVFEKSYEECDERRA